VEVDLLIEREARILPVEIKASATLRPALAQGAPALQRDLPNVAREGYVVHSGDIRLPLAPRVTPVPFAAF
jgi:hypothetical protein